MPLFPLELECLAAVEISIIALAFEHLIAPGFRGTVESFPPALRDAGAAAMALRCLVLAVNSTNASTPLSFIAHASEIVSP